GSRSQQKINHNQHQKDYQISTFQTFVRFPQVPIIALY
ncbi:hypothetical protein ACTFIW_000102, partial [Dictyostelium discoideum]